MSDLQLIQMLYAQSYTISYVVWLLLKVQKIKLGIYKHCEKKGGGELSVWFNELSYMYQSTNRVL